MKTKSKNIRLPHSFRKPASAQALAMTKTGVALGISTAMLMPMSALAANDTAKKEEVEMEAVKVVDTVIDPNPNAEPGVPYKAKTSGDKRHVKPLAETPQTSRSSPPSRSKTPAAATCATSCRRNRG